MKTDKLTNETGKFVNPEKILTEIGLKEGQAVIDYGSGPGHWTIPAAKIVGNSGKVLAIDEMPEILALVHGKAELRKLTNIETLEINLEKREPEVEDKFDLIILANVMHFIKEKDILVKRLKKLLKKSGTVLLIDWSNERLLFGPPENYRLNQEDMMTLFENNNFKFQCTVDAGWHHFGFVFKLEKQDD